MRTLGPDASRVRMHQGFRTSVAADVAALTPEQDRAVLQEASFTDVTEIFSAFTFRGWVGYA